MPAANDPTSEAQRFALTQKDKPKLKAWLEGTDRKYLVLNALDLVDSLHPFENIVAVMTMLDAYRDHRRTKPSGYVESTTIAGKLGEAPVPTSQFLEEDEVRECIAQLQKVLDELQAERAKRGAVRRAL